MKYFSLALGLAALLFSACNNADTPPAKPAENAVTVPAEGQPEAVPAAAPDKAQLDQIRTEAEATLAEVDKMLAQLETLPAAVKKKHAAAIESMKNDLSGMQEKQRDMLAQFNAMVQVMGTGSQDNPNQGGMSLQDFRAQFSQYAQAVPQYKEQIAGLK